MSTRNFDSRVITDRLQQCHHARYLHVQQTNGKASVANPQTSNGDASTMSLFHAGSPSFVEKGLLGGKTTVQPGGTC